MTGPDETETPAPAAEEAVAEDADALRRDLRAAREEAEAVKAQLQRVAADFDNHRKRHAREAETLRARAKEDVLAPLLDVLADFDRAIEGGGDAEALRQGLRLLHRRLVGVLEGFGLQRIDAVGHAFDPRLHEAVLREETTAYKDGVIVAELEKGYTLEGRVVRPAKVKVAVAPSEPAPEGPE